MFQYVFIYQNLNRLNQISGTKLYIGGLLTTDKFIKSFWQHDTIAVITLTIREIETPIWFDDTTCIWRGAKHVNILWWRRSPGYWSFVSENCKTQLDSSHKILILKSFDGFSFVSLQKMFNQLSSCQWPGTVWRPYDAIVIHGLGYRYVVLFWRLTACYCVNTSAEIGIRTENHLVRPASWWQRDRLFPFMSSSGANVWLVAVINTWMEHV